jgi:hypothetical protein
VGTVDEVEGGFVHLHAVHETDEKDKRRPMQLGDGTSITRDMSGWSVDLDRQGDIGTNHTCRNRGT